MADALRDTLIEKLAPRLLKWLTENSQLEESWNEVQSLCRVQAEIVVDAILTTLVDEGADQAMVEAGAASITIGTDKAVAVLVWEAMTAALRHGGETDNG